MVVVPEQRCALIVGIDNVARYPVRPNRSVGGCKPGVGAPVAGPWNVTAVQVHDRAVLRRGGARQGDVHRQGMHRWKIVAIGSAFRRSVCCWPRSRGRAAGTRAPRTDRWRRRTPTVWWPWEGRDATGLYTRP